MNTPKRKNLPAIYRGIDWVYEQTLCSDNYGEVPMDLSGYSAQCAFREGKEPSTAKILDITCTITAATGKVKLSITDTDSAAIASTIESGYYGLLMIDSDGISHPWNWGKIPVKGDFPTTET